MDLQIGEIHIGPDSMFAERHSIVRAFRQERAAIVLDIKRNAAMRFNPALDEGIESGDCLIAMGEPAQLRETRAAGRHFMRTDFE